jgi:post-segregation antitoxin (ccd killing protein)
MGPYAAPPTSRLWARREGRIDRRMPRMQVYLPEAMYEQVKTRGLPVSELLQKAVQAELRRQDLLAETDRYLGDLVAEVGAPSAAQRARAAAVARRLSRRVVRKAG